MSTYLLIGDGMAMGVIHVLTGPDHLSALATLSSNAGYNFVAFWYGVRWGIGHSIGLILVGSILIAITNSNSEFQMPEKLETILESLVGVFMLLLGCYHLKIAIFDQPLNNSSTDGRKSNDNYCDEWGEEMTEQFTITENPSESNFDDDDDDEEEEYKKQQQQSSERTESIFNHSQQHHHHHCGRGITACIVPLLCPLSMCKLVFQRCCNISEWSCCSGGCSKGVLSLFVGIVHGVAGPGGVLGVLPAVELHDWKLALVYLSTFCITSTVIMGFFAAFYGHCTTMLVASGSSAKFEFRMAVFSSSLSIIVGVLWLSLLSIGKLHDIFP